MRMRSTIITIATWYLFWLATFTLLADGTTTPSEIDQALTTLHAFGIRGIDGLCHHPNGGDDLHNIMDGVYPIPKCIKHGLRKRILQEEDANNVDGITIGGHHTNEMKFYLINITGAVISILVVCVISAMFLGFLTLDPLDIQVKMRAAIDP